MSKIFIVTCFICSFIILASPLAFHEVPFGTGAEDDEDNFPQSSLLSDTETLKFIGDLGAIKSTRQDPEDVEMFLSAGPMMAPDIILKQFVDSRVTLVNMEEAQKLKGNFNQSGNLTDANMQVDDDEEDEESMGMGIVSDDLTDGFAFGFSLDPRENSIFPQNSSHSDYLLKNNNNACHRRMVGSLGGFNMSFEQDCVILLESPNEDARLAFSCSPVPLGDCATHKDSLTINLLGDTTFKQNSFMYCGRNAKIRANSLKNKLAIRIKRMASSPVSTFCTFYSRKHREIDLEDSSVACGQIGRTARIIGGRRVPPGLFPWAVQLDITRTDGSQTGCTGSIVAPLYVLTAAHCMKRAESVSAFMGGTDRFDLRGTELLIQAEKYILHRRWSSKTLIADIALVKLTHPIEYAEGIAPICLPEGKMLREDFSGKRAVALGWGRTETKKKAPRRLFRIKLPLMTDITCKRVYRRFYIPKMMMCTDSKKTAAICYGNDTNHETLQSAQANSLCGPLMYKRQEKVYQIGVASFSLSRTCGASPDVFTKLGEFTDWVEKRIDNSNGDSHEE